MTIQRAFALSALALMLGAPVAAGAENVPAPNSLDAATNGYFDAVAKSDWRALSAGTTNTFHLVTPDGKRIDTEAFLRERIAHYLISSPAVVTVKIGASTIAGGSATESVDTSSFDWSMIGVWNGSVVEKDYQTHQLSWVKSSDGTWLLDEDHITRAIHTPW
jgi:hypothetical protein